LKRIWRSTISKRRRGGDSEISLRLYCGGAESDAAVRDNRKAFDEYGFVPRVLNDVSAATSRRRVRKTYASPFGIPPMVPRRLCAYRGDIVLTRAAAAANVPMILSAFLADHAEDVRRENEAPGIRPIWRAAGAHRAAGPTGWRRPLRHLVVTADVPVPLTAENNIRNGFQCHWITPQIAWIRSRTRTGCSAPGAHGHESRHAAFRKTWMRSAGPPVLAKNLMRNIGARDQLLEACRTDRKRWKGKLVVKGWCRRRTPGSRAKAASMA